MTINNHDLELEEIRNKIDDYLGTISALQAFISLVTFKNNQIIAGVHISIGRYMDTSERNQIEPNTRITPDVVIQTSKELGYVVEVKKTMVDLESAKEKIARQILKYDDQLRGWWDNPNELINSEYSVLLIHDSRSKTFSEYFINYIKEKSLQTSGKVAIIEFGRSDERTPNMRLRLEYGALEDDAIGRRLKYGIPIPIEKVVTTYGEKKFYDCEPPVTEYTMHVLWTEFNRLYNKDSYDRSLGGYPIEIEIESFTNELQKLYGQIGDQSRDVKFPLINWIRDALNGFVILGYARELDNGKYLIIFHRKNKDMIEVFSKISTIKKNKTKSQDQQLILFSNK